jgi:hypothetical protein
MMALFEPIEDCAGISDKRYERNTPCRPIPGGPVADDPVATIGANQRKVGRVGPGASLGATGDVNGPFKAEPGQQFGKPAGIATDIETRRPAGRRARTCFDSKQRIEGIGNEACSYGGIADRASGRCIRNLGVQDTPRRKPDLLGAESRHLAGKFAKLTGLDATEGRCDAHGKPVHAKIEQANTPIPRHFDCSGLARQRIQSWPHP